RRAGHLLAAPVPRTGRAGSPRRGVLRPALPGTGARPGAAHPAQPGPVPGLRSVPHPRAVGVPRLDRRPGVPVDEDRRVPRAVHVQPPRPPGAPGPARGLRPGPYTTTAWLPALH